MCVRVYLRCHSRKKNGKLHRGVVESRRVDRGDPVQRQVLYLGEIKDTQEAAWRKYRAAAASGDRPVCAPNVRGRRKLRT